MLSTATEKFYAHGAMQFLRRALGPDGDRIAVDEQLEKFRSHHITERHILTLNTVGVYRRFLDCSMRVLEKRGADPSRAAEISDELQRALGERIGEPAEPRTSSKKVDVPDFDDVRKTFEFVRDRSLKRARTGKDATDKDREDVILTLYLLCAHRLGVRPIELLGARREGDSVIVRTAKRSGNPKRPIPLLGWIPEHVLALDLLLELVPRNIDVESYVRWRGRLASRLARASLKQCETRISLYFGRHTAIARWRELRLSKEQIRLLAGHVGLESQRGYGQGAGRSIQRWVSTAERVAAARYIEEARDTSENPFTESMQVTEAIAKQLDETDALFDRGAPSNETPSADGALIWHQYEVELERLGDKVEKSAERLKKRSELGRQWPGPG